MPPTFRGTQSRYIYSDADTTFFPMLSLQAYHAECTPAVFWRAHNAECGHAEHVLQAAQRAIKNKALSYLSALKDPQITADLLQRTRSATNMTDQISALACLVDSEGGTYTGLQASNRFLLSTPVISGIAASKVQCSCLARHAKTILC